MLVLFTLLRYDKEILILVKYTELTLKKYSGVVI